MAGFEDQPNKWSFSKNIHHFSFTSCRISNFKNSAYTKRFRVHIVDSLAINILLTGASYG